MVEKRGYPRYPVLRGAKVECARGVYYSCEVKDLSERGARLRLSTRRKLPKAVNIEIETLNSQHSGQVRWQDGQEVGVEFVESTLVQ
ncbi:MAG TPA: PilZ domain-containing protein [Aestuariivirgaceae bacterium]|jgi:hypothetical protein